MAELTGRKVLAITVGAFSVIIAVNLLLAYKAVSTFPGLEVANSYVASQDFDARRDAQTALGWTMDAGYDPAAGALRIAFVDAAGAPVQLEGIKVLVGRATEAADDAWPEFKQDGAAYTAPITLAPGRWMMKVQALASNGTVFEQRVDLMVRG